MSNMYLDVVASIKEYMKQNNVVSETEIYSHANKYSSDYNKSFLMTKIYDSCAYRYYKDKIKYIGDRLDFKVEIDTYIKKIFEKSTKFLTISCWDSSVLSKFMNMQLMKQIYVIEVSDACKDVVLDVLLKNGFNAILKEDYNKASKYLSNGDVYIVKTMNQDSPINKKKIKVISGNLDYLKLEDSITTIVTTPKVEKILVDIYADKVLKKIYQGEIENIYIEILRNYKVNITTLFRYAKKKYVYDEINDFLELLGYDLDIGEFKYDRRIFK